MKKTQLVFVQVYPGRYPSCRRLKHLAGTTLDILGIKQLSSAKVPTVGYVPKQKVQKDVQFRGAISDLYSLRGEVANLGYDPVAFRSNPQDTFGDGNNFEVSCCSAYRLTAPPNQTTDKATQRCTPSIVI